VFFGRVFLIVCLCSESKTKELSKVEKKEAVKKLTPQERLKKRMQVMLNKQFKSDKVKEREKEQQREQERKEREDDLRELTRVYREKAHRGDDDDWFDSYYRSRSQSHSPSPRGNLKHSTDSNK
jgi:predicted nucleic acid-binding protein